ncbi:MAG: J domain-containing protein [Thermomicrobium sp.]|nr:J domain-containing protein [Thermomicrobium sp.]MDW8058905.1 J domain-containing protein [Thermomicrobium sp.]
MERHDVPAPLSILDRVRLELDYLVRGERLRTLRQRLTMVELAHEELRSRLERRLGPLQREAESLRNEVKLLESRLNRLLRVSRPLSDEELDATEFERREDRDWRDGNGRYQEFGAQSREDESLAPNGEDHELLRRLYRMLARLLHPDLARDQAERSEREHLMRIVNQAWERRDLEQLQRLASVWMTSPDGDVSGDLHALRQRLARREFEEAQLLRRLRELECSDLGQLLRRGSEAVDRYLIRQETLLRHEIAVLRLRRRRLIRLIEERRRELAVRSSSQG